MLTGRAPFRVAVPEDPSFAMLVREGTYKWPRILSKSARGLLVSILCVDPDRRPSTDDILKSEWCSMASSYDTPWFACQGPVERPLSAKSQKSAPPSKRRKTAGASGGGAVWTGDDISAPAASSEDIERTNSAESYVSEGKDDEKEEGAAGTATTDESIFMVGSVIHPLGWGGIPGGPSTVDVCVGRIEAVLSAHFGEKNKRGDGGDGRGSDDTHVGIRGSIVFVGNLTTAMAVTVVPETKETVRICQRVSSLIVLRVHGRDRLEK